MLNQRVLEGVLGSRRLQKRLIPSVLYKEEDDFFNRSELSVFPQSICSFCRIEMNRIVRIQPMQYIHLLDLVSASKIKFDRLICLNSGDCLETFVMIVLFYLVDLT